MEEEDQRDLERLEREFDNITGPPPEAPEDGALPPPRDPTKLPEPAEEVTMTKEELRAEL